MKIPIVIKVQKLFGLIIGVLIIVYIGASVITLIEEAHFIKFETGVAESKLWLVVVLHVHSSIKNKRTVVL